MTKSQNEQLHSLSKYQRAEFLRMQRAQVACAGKIVALREKTAALFQKQWADDKTFEKLEMSFCGVAVALAMLQLIFEFSSSDEQLAFFIATLIIASTYVVIKTVHQNHDKALFESYSLEIMRYESEIEMSGLAISYAQEDDLTRDILNALGFHDGAIGGVLNARPLEAAD